MGKTRAECSQNAYTSHASAFFKPLNTNFSKILRPKSDIKKKNKKKTRPCFFAFYGRSGEGKHKKKKNLALHVGLLKILLELQCMYQKKEKTILKQMNPHLSQLNVAMAHRNYFRQK